MLKFLFLLALLLIIDVTFSQKVEKENLTQKVKLFWDLENKNLQAIGSYYKTDLRGETTEMHGKWLFYSYDGVLEEERNYYRNRIHGLQTIYFPNKNVKQQTYFTFNVPDSSFKEWNEDGNLLVSGNYDLGSPDRIWEYFYENGGRKSIEEVINDTVFIRSYYVNDSLHTQTISNGNGFIKTFYLSGVTKEVYTFKNGLKTGLFEERTANGQLSISGSFMEGKKDSTWKFYNYSGILEKKIAYKNDSLDGEYLVYHEGQLINTKGTYKNGRKTGEWTWNFLNGNPEMIGSFKEDLQQGKWTYFNNSGGVSYTANFDHSMKVGEWIYYFIDGKEERRGSYLNDLKTGLWETWYEDGSTLMSGFYKNGKEEGEWFNFWGNGVLKNKSTFKNGQLNGKWYSYTPEKILVCYGTYKNGLKTGEWNSYYNNGKIKEIISYKLFLLKNNSNDISIMGMKKLLSEAHGKYVAFSQLDFLIKAEGSYKKGQKHGVWYDYYPGGLVPTIIASYRNGELHGVFQQLGRRGELIYEINYKNGLKDGWFIAFDSNGQESARKMFLKGIELKKQSKGNFFEP